MVDGDAYFCIRSHSLIYMQNTTYFFIDSDTAGMVCGRVYVTMRCTFVCPIVWLPYTAAPGLLLWTQRAGDIDRQQRLQRARSSSGATA